jgi:hypothetical protein
MDEELRGLMDPKIAHRLNNLSTVLIMKGILAEAEKFLELAWSIKRSTGHDITSPRVLLVRLTLAMLESKPTDQYICQLRTLTVMPELSDNADVIKTWDIADFIEFLKPKLGEHNAEFLTALVAAMNDRTKLSTLDQFPEWRNQSPVPLDTPWL